MTTATHVIIYSNGFGVRKEDRGLFTAIAKALPDAQHVMFDYNPIHDESNTLTVKPLDAHAAGPVDHDADGHGVRVAVAEHALSGAAEGGGSFRAAALIGHRVSMPMAYRKVKG